MSRVERRAAERVERAAARRGRKAAALSSAAVLASAGAGAAVVMTEGAAGANPVLVVDTLADGGAGSLRQAILDANSTGGQDRIEFTVAGTMTLSADLPVISDGVDIAGPGAGSLTVDGDGAYRVFRIDTVTTGTVSIDGLTVTGSIQAGIAAYYTDVPITLSSMVVTGNVFSRGAGIQVYNNITDITISDVTVSDNSAYLNGGGLYADAGGPGQHITITGSRFTNNDTDGSGGGIHVRHSTLLVSDTTVSGNTAGNAGGGVSLYETYGVTLDGVTVTGNQALGGGGIAAGAGEVTITHSTISDNDGYIGGGLFEQYGTMTVTASTVSGNDALVFGGGAASYFGATVAFQNATVSGNSAEFGGGIVVAEDSTATLASTTVTANTARATPDAVHGIMVAGAGLTGIAERIGGRRPGPLVAPPAGVLEITGSIVAGNGNLDVGSYGDVPVAVGTRSSVLGLVDAATVTVIDLGGTVAGVTAEQLLLGPLADNGGPTLTHALLSGSVAIDAGGTTVGPFAGSEWDQRGDGYFRLVNGVADAGAFEVQPPPEPEPTFTG